LCKELGFVLTARKGEVAILYNLLAFSVLCRQLLESFAEADHDRYRKPLDFVTIITPQPTNGSCTAGSTGRRI
jgi:hypothetical protein